MDEKPRRRRGTRAEQRRRAREASRLVEEGMSRRLVAKRLGFPSESAVYQAVRRYRLRNGTRPNTGWVKISRSTGGSVRLALSTNPIRRARWKDGTPVRWAVADGTVTLRAAERLSAEVARHDPADPDSVAFFLHRVRGREITDVACELGVSRSEAYRMVVRHASRHPWLSANTRSPNASEGVVHVTRRGSGLSLLLVSAAQRLGWGTSDIVRWDYDGKSRVLRLTLETSASQAAG